MNVKYFSSVLVVAFLKDAINHNIFLCDFFLRKKARHVGRFEFRFWAVHSKGKEESLSDFYILERDQIPDTDHKHTKYSINARSLGFQV